eukprot:scaffold6975_cov117-Isochrysis_galbana.AAC.2
MLAGLPLLPSVPRPVTVPAWLPRRPAAVGRWPGPLVPAIGVRTPAARGVVRAAVPAPVAVGRVAGRACVARPLAPPRLGSAAGVLAFNQEPRAVRLEPELRDGCQQVAQRAKAKGAHVELAAEVLLVLGRQRGRVLACACAGDRRAGKGCG